MSSKKHGNPQQQPEVLLQQKAVSPEREVPSVYQVYLLNDDYTPMGFVVEVLERFFSMNRAVATEIMLQVHQHGKGICGLYIQEIAETKVVQVNEYAKRNQHPLLCKMEEISV